MCMSLLLTYKKCSIPNMNRNFFFIFPFVFVLSSTVNVYYFGGVFSAVVIVIKL